jgi:hypothetical protein
VKGFENSAPAWLAQAQLCAGARVFRFSSVSAFPPFSLCPYFRFQHFIAGREHSVILKNVGVNLSGSSVERRVG